MDTPNPQWDTQLPNGLQVCVNCQLHVQISWLSWLFTFIGSVIQNHMYMHQVSKFNKARWPLFPEPARHIKHPRPKTMMFAKCFDDSFVQRHRLLLQSREVPLPFYPVLSSNKRKLHYTTVPLTNDERILLGEVVFWNLEV